MSNFDIPEGLIRDIIASANSTDDETESTKKLKELYTEAVKDIFIHYEFVDIPKAYLEKLHILALLIKENT